MKTGGVRLENLCFHETNVFGTAHRLIMKRHILECSYYGFLPPANEVWGKVIFSEVCVENSIHRGEGCYPSMHCSWYPSMPCSRSPGGSPGPHPRGS